MLHFLSRRRLALAGCALIVIVTAAAGTMYWRTARALEAASAEITAEESIALRVTALDRAPAGFEFLPTPPQFTGAAGFNGKVYLCGRGGLFEYDEDGRLTAQYLVGRDLPPAPLAVIAKGVASDTGRPELWIGTAGEGLLRFDGRAFRQIRSNSAKHLEITGVLPTGTGRILFGTRQGGVLVYDGRTLKSFHATLQDLHVTSLAGSESSLWIGTADRGVLHFRAGELRQFDLAEKHVLALTVAGDRAYASTAAGITEFANDRIERNLGSGLLAGALLVQGNKLLAATVDQGLFEIPLEARAPRPSLRRTGEWEQEVVSLIELDGAPFALTRDGLHGMRNRGQWTERTESRLTDGNVSALSIDSEGRLWAGYFDRGLDIIDVSGSVRHVEDDHLFCVNRIVHDNRRSLTAVATANGLGLFDTRGILRQVLGRGDGLIANHVTDVAITASGMIAATPAGVTFLDAAGPRSIYAFHGLVNNHAYALAEAGGRLLVGTLGGLSVLQQGAVEASYTTANSPLRHNWISALVHDGSEWFVGTYGAGVVRLGRSGEWKPFDDLPPKLEISPNAMAVGPGRIYAGSVGKGLFVYNATDGRWRNVVRGLPSLNVTAIHSRGGRVYIGTDNGVVSAPEEAL